MPLVTIVVSTKGDELTFCISPEITSECPKQSAYGIHAGRVVCRELRSKTTWNLMAPRSIKFPMKFSTKFFRELNLWIISPENRHLWSSELNERSGLVQPPTCASPARPWDSPEDRHFRIGTRQLYFSFEDVTVERCKFERRLAGHRDRSRSNRQSQNLKQLFHW